MKEQIPLMYLCIHKKLENKFKDKVVPIKNVFEVFGKYYRINKKLRYPILKEMENLKLIKKENKCEILILNCSINLENTSKIYKMVGLY